MIACGDDSSGAGEEEPLETGNGDTGDGGGGDVGGDVGEDAYVHPSGCIQFAPADSWQQIEETGLGVDYDADPENPLSPSTPPGMGPAPGEPGVFVSATCSPLDQVGADGPVPLPGFEVIEDKELDFGGGSGRLVAYEIEQPGAPAHTELQVTVDMNDARCALTVVGASDVLAGVRGDIDAAIDSYVCHGR